MIKELRLTIIFMAAFTVVGIAAFIGVARAEEKSNHDMHDLSKQSQNPVSKLISVPFEMNNTFNNGSEDAYVMTLNISRSSRCL